MDTATIASTLIIGSICHAIHGSVRTRKLIEKGRTNWGLAMVLIGRAIIALHYLANLAILYVLPHFLPASDIWILMRSLRLNGYWFIIGIGVLFLVFGLHLVFRDLRSLANRLHRTERNVGNQPAFGGESGG